MSLTDYIIEGRLKHLSKLKEEITSLSKNTSLDKLWKKLLLIPDSKKEGLDVIDDFIEKSRENKYFRNLYEKIKNKEFNMNTLTELDKYKSLVLDPTNMAHNMLILSKSVDSRLASFVEPLKSLPYFYTKGKTDPNCQALAQITTILHSYDHDIDNLEYKEAIATDKRDYYLDLLEAHKDLKDDYFYIILGKDIVGGDEYFYGDPFKNLISHLTKKPKTDKEIESEYNAAAYGNQIKNQLLNMVLGLEEPHAIIYNKKKKEDYDVYKDEERVSISHDIKKALYFTTMLDLLFIRNNPENEESVAETYNKLLNSNPDSYTLRVSGINLDNVRNVKDHLNKTKDIFKSRDLDLPAKHYVQEIMLHSPTLFSEKSRKIIKKDVDYLKRKYILPDVLNLIGQKYNFPMLKHADELL